MSNHYVTRVGIKTHPPLTSGRELYERETEERDDDGAVIVHAGDWFPTCSDCRVGTLQWAEAGYVPWHRICDQCGSRWDLHPLIYFIDHDGAIRTENKLPPDIERKLLEAGMFSPERIAESIAETRGVPTLSGCWAQRARFYDAR